MSILPDDHPYEPQPAKVGVELPKVEMANVWRQVAVIQEKLRQEQEAKSGPQKDQGGG